MINETSFRTIELRARLRYIVQAESGTSIRAVHDLLNDLHEMWPEVPTDQLISPAQLSGLRNAAAWHETRTTADARLKALDAELQRLKDRSSDTLAAFYKGLQQMISADIQEGQPEPHWHRLMKRIDMNANEMTIWRHEAQLATALMILDTLLAIYRTRAVQLTVKQQGGLEWP